MSALPNRSQTIQQLASRLRRLERSRAPSHTQDTLSTGIASLDQLLPEGGVRPGTLVECLSRNAGSGAGTIACTMAAHAMRDHGSCVVIDRRRLFFPAAAWPLADDLHRLVVVHPRADRDLLWAVEQALRCPGVSVVVCWTDRIHAHAYRRLQLAVETGGGVGLLLRPDDCRSQPSWADTRLFVEPLPFELPNGKAASPGTEAFSTRRLLRIELIHCRGRSLGGAVELEINDETCAVRLAPRLATPTNSRHAAGA